MPKEQIEEALNKAIRHVVVQHVVDEYARETDELSVEDVPKLLERVRQILT